MNTKKIYAIPADENGWRLLPSSNYVTLGKGVTLGRGVTLGNYVTLGKGVTLGRGVTLGNYVTLGDGVTLGRGVTLGDGVTLGRGVTLGNYVTLGNGVRLGNYVTLGDGVTFDRSPLAVQGSQHLACNTGHGLIQIGCHTHTFAEWISDYATIGKENRYSQDEIAEYKRIIEFIVANGVQP